MTRQLVFVSEKAPIRSGHTVSRSQVINCLKPLKPKIIPSYELFAMARDITNSVVVYFDNAVHFYYHIILSPIGIKILNNLNKNKSIFYAVTEGPIDEDVKQFVESHEVVVTSSRYAAMKMGISAIVIPHYVERFLLEMEPRNRIFDVATVISGVGERHIIRKGTDIIKNVASVTKDLLYVTSESSPLEGDNVVRLNDTGKRVDIFRMLLMSKVLLWPSRSEGFGLPVLEAMAAGAVPVCSDAPAHNEFCEGVKIQTKYVGSVVTHPNMPYYRVDWYDSCWEDYIKGIHYALEHWEELSERARKRVIDEYSEEVICKKWIDLINSLI